MPRSQLPCGTWNIAILISRGLMNPISFLPLCWNVPRNLSFSSLQLSVVSTHGRRKESQQREAISCARATKDIAKQRDDGRSVRRNTWARKINESFARQCSMNDSNQCPLCGLRTASERSTQTHLRSVHKRNESEIAELLSKAKAGSLGCEPTAKSLRKIKAPFSTVQSKT